MRFAVTTMTGTARKVERTRFAFLTRHIADVPSRRFALAPDEVLKMNPNTGTLPMFRTRTDADITLGIYAATLSSSATAIPTATPGDCHSARCSTWPTTPLFSTSPNTLGRRVQRLVLQARRQGVRTAV